MKKLECIFGYHKWKINRKFDTYKKTNNSYDKLFHYIHEQKCEHCNKVRYLYFYNDDIYIRSSFDDILKYNHIDDIHFINSKNINKSLCENIIKCEICEHEILLKSHKYIPMEINSVFDFKTLDEFLIYQKNKKKRDKIISPYLYNISVKGKVLKYIPRKYYKNGKYNEKSNLEMSICSECFTCYNEYIDKFDDICKDVKLFMKYFILPKRKKMLVEKKLYEIWKESECHLKK